MKKYTAILSLLCIVSSTAFAATKGVYKIKKHVETSNLSKVLAAIKAAGPLDPEEKNKLLELADDVITSREKISMSAWDKTKFVSGLFLSLFLANTVFYAKCAYEFQNQPVAPKPALVIGNQAPRDLDQQELIQNALINGALGLTGLWLVKSGWNCNGARARLAAAKKIEEALEAAAQKSFNTVQNMPLKHAKIS